ncbi:hypothetical protein STSP2_01014 [Anaerohalosphaera lusitana]|uniref:Mucoidy inhibitor MuiA family protein n=1 Tax=Anaerohalosphaera lusitana TaxID=1936003 RepID=A0A1U9NIV1_9BACT|nr:DUF4139 domain-containing protein [Anaerohalosphaera lusitana]AQT67862.1 hypothetical protein STSP2_01014 [Anaerohalosphaera lusitana]
MKHTATLFITILLTTAMLAPAAEPQTTTGQITDVTVYHGQALVTRTLDLELPTGTSEVVVDDLPNHILPDSIYALSDNGTKVISIRYRNQPVEEDTRQEIKELEERIEQVNNEITEANRQKMIGQDMNVFYKGLWGLSVDGTDADLEHGLIKANEIEKLTMHLEDRYVEWHNQMTEMMFRINELNQQLDFLKRQRDELNAGSSKTKRQAVLYLQSPSKTQANVTVNYLVNGANWIPSYNLRAVPDESTARIEYNAVVNQTSGENWNNVAVELSTAQPTMTATPPTLQPMEITLSARTGRTNQPPTKFGLPAMPGMKHDQSAVSNLRSLNSARQRASQGGVKAQQQLEKLAMGNQMLEFSMAADEVKAFKKAIAETPLVEGISVTYKLPGRMTLPSRSDQQIVTIAASDVPAEFTLVATPLLTDYVYLQGELTNSSDIIFLPGKASIFRNGEFAGTGDMPLVTVGEKFTTGFGADSQVQAVRLLEDKITRIQGGNQIDTYTYKITIKNYKDTETSLRLLDRLPYTEDKSIRIELTDAKPKLAEKKPEKGILTWNLTLPPDTTADNATTVSYTYTMEYDKSMRINTK